ncbi:MAG: YebC/PmpR family DNA-binding transcriptional regulator [Planctomycetota bacterium]|nr:YebC/PmpR family DNA-binding transcriptional regulator [Planctomycetota bacterium]
MAGHSHWANIQRKKSKVDAKRGKIFSKWAKHLMAAARDGGSDPAMNLKLRYAIDRAKADNMPNDSIDRAVKKGAGELDGHVLEEVLYEGYAPGGVAIMIETLTDNRNRTAPVVRAAMSKRGGSIANNGTVSYMFHRKAVFAITRNGVDEEQLLELGLENGAEDVTTDQEEIFGVVGPADSFNDLTVAFAEAGYDVIDAGLRYIPDNYVPIDQAAASSLEAIIDLLEDDDDIQAVHHNAEFPS